MGADAEDFAGDAIDDVVDVINDHVEIDCGDYGVRVTTPASLQSSLEAIQVAGSVASLAFEQAILLAEPYIDQGLIAAQDVEDVFFEILDENAPSSITTPLNNIRDTLDPIVDDLIAGDETAYQDFVVTSVTQMVDYAQDIINSSGVTNWEVKTTADLVLNVPTGETAVVFLVQETFSTITNFLETGQVVVPCPSQLIDIGNFPAGFETDTVDGFCLYEGLPRLSPKHIGPAGRSAPMPPVPASHGSGAQFEVAKF